MVAKTMSEIVERIGAGYRRATVEIVAVDIGRVLFLCIFFFQAKDGIRDVAVTGVQTCALPIYQDSPDPESGVLPITPRGTNGAEGARTPDLLGAIQALSQLSYSPARDFKLNSQGGWFKHISRHARPRRHRSPRFGAAPRSPNAMDNPSTATRRGDRYLASQIPGRRHIPHERRGVSLRARSARCHVVATIRAAVRAPDVIRHQ